MDDPPGEEPFWKVTMKPSFDLLAPSPRPSPPLRAGERDGERGYVLSPDELPPHLIP